MNIDESANALFKRIGKINQIFNWNLINKSSNVLTREEFKFDEIIEVTGYSKDMQELRLDLVLSFASWMKNSNTNALVVHVSIGDNLKSTLIHSGESQNPLIIDLNSQGRLKCLQISSAQQLYALLDLLQWTLNDGATSPNGTLLVLDNLKPLLNCSSINSNNNSSNDPITKEIPNKLRSLTEAQAVFGVWISSEVPSISTSTTSTSPWDGLFKKRHHYVPRVDIV
jgi:hypothetical protein